MLARRTYASASELDGKIYVMGGHRSLLCRLPVSTARSRGSADGRTLNTFEVFEPKAGRHGLAATFRTKCLFQGRTVGSVVHKAADEHQEP